MPENVLDIPFQEDVENATFHGYSKDFNTN